MSEDEADAVIAGAEADEHAEFDRRLLEAMLKKAGEVGELRLGWRDLKWFLKMVGADVSTAMLRGYSGEPGDDLRGCRIVTPTGMVRIIVDSTLDSGVTT